MKMERIPAVPLMTCDPFFSIWSPSDRLYESDTMHWSGQIKRIRGTACVDGVTYRFLGTGQEPCMEQTGLTVTAVSSVYHFQAAGVCLKVDFWTPLLLDDLDVLSRPCSYVDISVWATDGKRHTVEVEWTFTQELCYDGPKAKAMGGGSYLYENSQVAWMGRRTQTPLGQTGDGVTIDWGYLYLASSDRAGTQIGYEKKNSSLYAAFSFEAEEQEEKVTLIAAYDDIASIFYFGRMLPGYWARNGKGILAAINEAGREHDELRSRCQCFEKQLDKEAGQFGEEYKKLCCAAYRQSIAAHKLIADEQGKAVFLSKECFSNGCIGTVDVTYPSTPLYFCFNPELVWAMMRPILKFARMDVWQYDFAPHDVGRYPYAAGQVYGLEPYQKAFADVGTAEEQGYLFPMFYQMPQNAQPYCLKNQMPVEESGNMLILAAQLVRSKPQEEWNEILRDMDLYEKWVKYLLKYGSDPGEQLCTDDFAGHLAHNVNLAIKAIMGVEAYSILLEADGREGESHEFHEKAVRMAADVWKRADAKDHTKLTFDGPDESWSLKYNAVWDLVFGSKLWPEKFYENEQKQYRKMENAYGIPLDSRDSYTKSDWMMWCAAMNNEAEGALKHAQRMAAFLEESPDRVPFSDWYDTVSGRQIGFQNRTVQGGIFMPILRERYRIR